MLICNFNGLVLEKVSSKKQGTNEDKLQLRIFQKGNKDLVTCTVSQKTFNTAKENEPIQIQAKADSWSNDGNSGFYVTEIF